MSPLAYAQRFVNLWQNSPVAGPFDEKKYPFVSAPLERIADILVRCMVIYGPSQSFKTVLMQIATAYRLDVMRSSLLAVAQTDDDSKSFAEVKLNPFLKRIPALWESLKNDKYAFKIMQWLWANHELIISGPGENAQNSKSVLYLHTDEAHLWCKVYPGALTALQGRMGERWNQAELHCTTAADVGTEIDILYHNGEQNEWHQRCIHCDKLIWPLWEEESRAQYNGHEVFKWDELPNEDAMLDSIRMACPHCDKEIFDTYRNRIDMDDGASYVSKNESASKANASYRWNCFAPRWKKWRTFLAKYKSALQSVKLGELAPFEEWTKKYLVVPWRGQYPDIGGASASKFSRAQIEVVEGELRTASFDIQEGKGGEGFHIWGLAESWERCGTKSKRLDYQKLASYADARDFQLRHGVKNIERTKDSPYIIATAMDCGDRDREVFGICAKYGWLALKSGDEEQFAHEAADQRTRRIQMIYLPYSSTRLESSTIGKEAQKNIVFRSRPEGFAVSRLWSKPKIYPILYRLKKGDAGREYGIPNDINTEYPLQLNSYIPSEKYHKGTNVLQKVEWIKTRPSDHGFVCSAQGLVLAIIAGYYPLASIPLETAKIS